MASSLEAPAIGQDSSLGSTVVGSDLYIPDGTIHDMGNGSSSHRDLKQQATSEIPRIEPTLSQVVAQMKIVTAQTAIRAIKDISLAYELGPITSEAREQLEVDLDVNATPVMETQIHNAPYRTKVRKTEGEKEKRKYGRVLPGVRPVLGFGELLKIESADSLALADGTGDVELVLDPIEGTKRASNNSEGATAMSGGSIKGRLPEIPGEESAHYNNRRIAGRRVAQLIRDEGITGLSDKSITELAELTARAFNVPLSEVEFIYLDRERNQAEIDELRAIGVTKIRLIPDGDLVPALEVLTKDKPMVSAGSGGKEEAAIAAYGAKVTDGYFEGHYVDKDGGRLDEYPQTLTLDEMTPGNKEDYFVAFAAITDVPELGLARVDHVHEAGKDEYDVTVAVLTSEQSYLQKDVLKLQADGLPKAA